MPDTDIIYRPVPSVGRYCGDGVYDIEAVYGLSEHSVFAIELAAVIGILYDIEL